MKNLFWFSKARFSASLLIKYKIQEGLKPDRNNAREGRIVGRDAEGARRGLCAACPPRPRGATAVRRPDRFQWPVV